MIWVHQLDAFAVRPEREGCFIAGDALVSEVLENLLESRLGHTVLLDAQVFPVGLELAEKPANRLTFLWHA